MHGPSSEWKKDNSSTLKELIGKWLFVFYTAIYAGFICINVMSPKFMGIDVGSLNVAIFYGILLIVLAVFMAIAYNHVCTHAEEVMNKDEETEEPKV